MPKAFDMDVVFSKIEEKLRENPKPIEKMNAVYQFDLEGDVDKTYQLHLLEGKVMVEHGESTSADCRIKMKENDFLDMLLGKLNGISAFVTGKIKVKGNMDLAMKLQKVLGSYDR